MSDLDNALREHRKRIDRQCMDFVNRGLANGSITHNNLYILNGDTMYDLSDEHGDLVVYSLTQNKVYSYGGSVNPDYIVNEYFINNTTIDKVIMPPILYKYREAEKPEHSLMTQTGSIWFAPPNSFEDPLDCKIPIRYDLLTDQEIYDKYYTEIKKMHPNWLRQKLDVATRAEVRRGLLRDKKHLEEVEQEHWKRINEQFGVLSLTENFTNPKMWEKYSANLNGFCIGMNSGILFSKRGGGGGIVTYCDTLPIVKPFEQAEIQYQKLTFHKERKWDFEDEFRTHKTWDHSATIKERAMPLPGHAFETIIIGESVQPDVKQQIIDEVKQLNPNIEVKYARLNGDDIEIL